MGLGKAFKKAVKSVAKVGQKATNLPGLKQIKQGGRALTAGMAGVTTLGLLPKGGAALGIHSKLSKLAYRGGGNVGKVAAAVAGGAALGAGAGGAAGATGTAGGWAGAGKTAMGALSLGKGALGMLGGQGGQGGGSLGDLAGIYGAYQGYKGSEAAQEDISRYEGGSESLINRQTQLAGLDPVVAAQMKHQASQDLRASQAERGIYESGVGAKQEAELMPQIEQQQRSWQLNQLAGISGQYTPLMESAGRRAGTYQDMAGGFGQAMAGPTGGGSGGGFDLASLAGKAWDWGSGLFGQKDQGYNLGSASLAGQGYGGTYY